MLDSCSFACISQKNSWLTKNPIPSLVCNHESAACAHVHSFIGFCFAVTFALSSISSPKAISYRLIRCRPLRYLIRTLAATTLFALGGGADGWGIFISRPPASELIFKVSECQRERERRRKQNDAWVCWDWNWNEWSPASPTLTNSCFHFLLLASHYI